jgi:ATP-binding cassette subfamily C protein LapB
LARDETAPDKTASAPVEDRADTGTGPYAPSDGKARIDVDALADARGYLEPDQPGAPAGDGPSGAERSARDASDPATTPRATADARRVTDANDPEAPHTWALGASHLTPQATDPILAALMVLCGLHDRPRSAASLTAGLPLEDGQLTLKLLPLAADRAHLRVRTVRRTLSQIAPHVLPVILLMEGRATCIVTRMMDGGRVEIIVPELGEERKTVPRRELEETYSGYAILAAPRAIHRGETIEALQKPRGHWFWSTLLRMGRVYVFVIMAAIMVNLFALAGPLFTMNVYDRVVPNQAVETLWALASGVAIVYAFDFLLRLIRAYLIDHTGTRADVVMSSTIFSHALNVRMADRPASSGAFANRLKEFDAVREFFTSATVVAIVDIPFIFFFIFVIYVIAGPAAYVPLTAVPVVILAGLLLQPALRGAARQTSEGGAHKHGILVESLGALDTIKSLGAEGRVLRDWETYAGESAKLGARVKFLSSLGVHFSIVVQQLVTVGVIIVGVHQISLGEMTMGGLIAATILTGRVMAPLGQMAGLLSRLHHASSARKSINEIMKLPVDRPDGRRFLSRPALAGALTFQSVTFTYPGAQSPALKDVGLRVDPGRRLAIVGPVGSGKSTVTRLITRLFDPDEGSIQIDGTDIQQIDPADIRRTVGVVLQDVVLFSGSVRDNIAMGSPDADDQMIINAARLAGAHDFISRHPMGYDMPVGERGSLLSGGQRQAVALARALLPDPPILVMDEPTSMMDIPSEQAFVQRLDKSLRDKALIIVTHRPSLLEVVDEILVLKRGAVAAVGPRDQIRPRLRMGGRPVGGRSRMAPDSDTDRNTAAVASTQTNAISEAHGDPASGRPAERTAGPSVPAPGGA